MEQAPKITQFLQTGMVATGTWRLKLTENKLLQKLYQLHSIFCQIAFFCFIGGLVLNLPHLIKKRDFQSLTENTGYTVFLLVMLSKMRICQSKEGQELIVLCITEEQRIKEAYSADIQKEFAKGTKILHRINTFVVSLSLIAILSFFVAKYTEYLEFRKFDSTVDKPLVIPIWYPFNPNEYYGIAFIIGYLFSFVGSIFNVVTQVFFITLMSHIALHIKVLKSKCTNFHLVSDHTKPEEYDSLVYKELRAICIKHQSIISFVGKLNLSAKNVLLLEFILNSLNITAVVVQILVMDNPPAMMFFCVVFCSVQIAQLFLMSWHANEIEIQSMSIRDVLFQSKWYEQSARAKRLIHIMIMRAKRPLNLFIGPFYPMSLRTGIATMKAAYSLLALILTLATEN